MKLLSLIALILFPVVSLHAQDSFLKGYALCKLQDNATELMDTAVNKDVLLQAAWHTFKIKYCRQPFKDLSPVMDKFYKIEYDPAMNGDSLVAALAKLSYIEYAEKMPAFRLFDTPDDFDPVRQYSLVKIEAQKAWDITTGSKKVVVAVIDNAINANHEDLSANIWHNTKEIPGNGLDDDFNGYIDDIVGYDVADDDNNPSPPASATDTSAWIHGSHCAGIVSATTGNDKGIASLGRNLSLMLVKCTSDTASGNNLYSAFDGMVYAIRAGADILSMSFGTTENSLIIQNIIDNAYNRGIVMIAAAGNENTETKSYPAAYDHVISVAATDLNDKRASFSNYGSWVDVCAPGVQIQSTFAATMESYGALSGTSMSTPLVAALAGLVLSIKPDATPDEVQDLIKKGCDDISSFNPAYNGKLGAGRINAYKTLKGFADIEPITSFPEWVVYPNPLPDGETVLHIKGSHQGICSFDLFDAGGRLVFTTVSKAGSNDTDVSLGLPGNIGAGVYVLQVVNQNSVYRQKILIW